MRDPLSIAVAQPRLVPGDLPATVATHVRAIRTAGARVVVFPELSLTGYDSVDPLDPADDVLAPLIDACGSAGAIAAVGAPVLGENANDGAGAGADDGTAGAGRPSIGVLLIDGEGARVAYRKINLGGNEPLRFDAGTRPVVVEVDGWRLGLAVCKDTGIPEHAATLATLGMDAYLAGVLEHAADARVTDERARRIAIQHGVWVAMASFAGQAGGQYQEAAGRSAVWRPDATAAARAVARSGAVVRAVLTP